MDKRFFNITQTGTNKVRIEIDGTIGGWDWDNHREKNTGTDIRKQLKEISKLQADEIEVLITSLGGLVDEAIQIHDALKEHPAKVTTIIQGFCASAATIIACAGDVRIISPNALYLIHKCRSYIVGNENDLEAELEAQRQTNEVILTIYKGVLKKDEKELNDLFEANHGEGKWITAEEAVAFGFATEIQEFQSQPKTTNMVASILNYARNCMPQMQHNPIVESNPIIHQNQKSMKKLLNFALLCALLSYSAETEFDEAQGLPLQEDKLQKLEDTLKEFEALKASASKTQEDLQGAQDALSSAQTTIAEKDNLIATLTAERDDYKSKYEANPAPVKTVNGPDVTSEPVDVTDNPVYAELEKYI